MDIVVQHAPHFSSSEAEQLADRLFGLTGEATPLDSERDQNFRIARADGRHVVLRDRQRHRTPGDARVSKRRARASRPRRSAARHPPPAPLHPWRGNRRGWRAVGPDAPRPAAVLGPRPHPRRNPPAHPGVARQPGPPRRRDEPRLRRVLPSGHGPGPAVEPRAGCVDRRRDTPLRCVREGPGHPGARAADQTRGLPGTPPAEASHPQRLERPQRRSGEFARG